MAIVSQAINGVLRQRLFSNLPVPESARRRAPRGLAAFTTVTAIALQAAADETHINLLCTLPPDFAYIMQPPHLSIVSTSAVNDYTVGWMTGGIMRSDGILNDEEYRVLTGSTAWSATAAAVYKVISYRAEPFSGVMQKPADPASIALSPMVNFSLLNNNGAEQPIMALKAYIPFLMYDLEQAQKWELHEQVSVINPN